MLQWGKAKEGTNLTSAAEMASMSNGTWPNWKISWKVAVRTVKKQECVNAWAGFVKKRRKNLLSSQEGQTSSKDLL